MVGNDSIPAALARHDAPEMIIASWAGDVAAWCARRAPFLLYP
jgi:hypothetical protein